MKRRGYLRLDDRTEIRAKHLAQDYDRHGNPRAFVRKNGRKVRIRALENAETFWPAYREALAALESGLIAARQQLNAAPGSLRWLVERYYDSSSYHMLEASTRAVRRRMLDAFCEKHGTKPYARLDAVHIAAFRDEKVRAGVPEAANSLLKVLRALFSWAADPEVRLAECNPCRDVKRIQTRSEGHHTWTVEEVFQFEDRHPVGSKARLAMALMLYTGVRASDAIRLGRQMERAGRLHFTEYKDRNRNPKDRAIPILPELRAIIDATPSGNFNYLVTEHGKPYASAKAFGNRVKSWCNMAGLPHCTAHGLRKAGATIAAERGVPAHALMALYGWTKLDQAALYTRKVDRMRLADEYMDRVVPERKEHGIVPPKPAVASGGTKGRKNAS
jgi:integrase